MAGNAASVETAAPEKGSASALVMAFAVVTMLGLAAGGGLAWWQGKTKPAESTTGQSAPQAQDHAALTDAVSVVLALPSIVTNLAGDNAPWVRLDISVVLPKAYPEKEKTAVELNQDILAYVRTLTTEQLAGGSNLQLLKQDLREIAQIRTGEAAVDVLIRTLVVE